MTMEMLVILASISSFIINRSIPAGRIVDVSPFSNLFSSMTLSSFFSSSLVQAKYTAPVGIGGRLG